MSNKNKIQYRRVGDYLIPNLIILPEEASVTLNCVLSDSIQENAAMSVFCCTDMNKTLLYSYLVDKMPFLK